MEKARKFGPEGAWTAPEGPRGDALQTAEASENAARSAPAGGRAASPWTIGPEAALFSRSWERRRGVSARRVGVRLGRGALPCPVLPAPRPSQLADQPSGSR